MRFLDATFLAFLVCLGWSRLELVASTDGSIGCLFNKSLCKEEAERCFDDYVFGKCVSHKNALEQDFHRYRLDGDSLLLLKKELDKLLYLGYRWSHIYTQCVLKNVLFAVRYQKEYNENKCKVLDENDHVLSYYGGNQEGLDPKSIGQVQFTPSVVDPHPEFADEIYVPVLEEEGILNDVIIPAQGSDSREDEDRVKDLRNFILLNKINKSNKENDNDDTKGYPEDFSQSSMDADVIPLNYFSYLNDLPRQDDEALETYDEFLPENPSDLESDDAESEPADLLANIFDDDRNMLKSFSRNYNTPEKFRDGHETKDEVVYPKVNPVQFSQPLQGFYSPEERQLLYDTFNVMQNKDDEQSGGIDKGVFTEGGVIYLKDGKKDDVSGSPKEPASSYGNWGFKRPERLDVKKPGPSIITMSEALVPKKVPNKDSKNKADEKSSESSASLPKTTHLMNLLVQPEKKKGGSPMESPSLRRQTTTIQPFKEKNLDIGNDSDFVHVAFKNEINNWQEGSRIARKIEDMLSLRPNTFTHIRVDQNNLKFKVEPNRFNLNASEVATRIEGLKDTILRKLGREVIYANTGNQSTPPSSSLLTGSEHQLWILSFLLCGLVAAIAITGAIFLVIKKHPNGTDKLEDLAQMDSEASKDYQELCRARMASKAAQEKSEGSLPGSKMSKDSEGSNHSPSSRSSTFSWSEEPALTNMDISTGHMVLSYMEDHLMNKERLDQEWIALCAYKAEPCETSVALKEENRKKNRYSDVIPYDHARVVLNELSNINGSDYINASTITDHDPRNPAYIACQGPLEHTTADFWQMVWEQGSVVMVMLTRLTENDSVLCHRYWPEEGSELYHIYEVHLVSEHIWCDDYLVRSFYLKNIKTGETRTVTQFHFLSWPENGVPLSTKALLKFRRKVNKSYRGRSCPVVVHCSDGVSRTGTYCLIDMVLNRMAKGAKEIDIAATLEHIRDQRALMVKTKQQFEFVLMAVAEEVHAILKALPASLNHSPPPVAKDKK